MIATKDNREHPSLLPHTTDCSLLQLCCVTRTYRYLHPNRFSSPRLAWRYEIREQKVLRQFSTNSISSSGLQYSTKISYSVTYVSIVCVSIRSFITYPYHKGMPSCLQGSTDTSRSSHLFRKAQYYEKSRSKKCLDNFRQMAFLPNCFKNLKFGDLRQYYVKSLHSDVHHLPERRVNAPLFSQRPCDSQAMMVISVHTSD